MPITERNFKIAKMLLETNMTLEQVGRHFLITKERVRQIACKVYKETFKLLQDVYPLKEMRIKWH